MRMKKFCGASITLCYVSDSDRGNDVVAHRFLPTWSLKSVGGLLLCMIGLSVVVSVSVLLGYHPSGGYRRGVLLDAASPAIIEGKHYTESDEASFYSAKNELISPELDQKSCLSRHHPPLNHRPTAHRRASPYLISKLRSYEARHKRCGPYTHPYNQTAAGSAPSDCKYIVLVTFNGLGNKIMTIASAFLYALLTDRVLLIDRGKDIPELFCEPFPEASWLLPLDFPLAKRFNGLNQTSRESFGNLLKNNSTEDLWSSHKQLYVHLSHDYDDDDKLFFCDREQSYLETVPLLVIRSDLYFVPSLFMIPSFEQELNRLFPDKETVFHLIGRYLFHPTNTVWGLVSRFYNAYLSRADVKVGIQLRVSEIQKQPGRPLKHIMDQILSCTTSQGILPKIHQQEKNYSRLDMEDKKNKPLTAVLITTLTRGYYDEMRTMYWENPTTTGEIIAVHQPSFEEYQKSDNKNHDMKAWAEMYLLSLTDKLITTSWSTFGYVAQGLGGLRPWILLKTENGTTPDPPCQRVKSMEPCFHAPPVYDCKTRKDADMGALVPHVRHCEDIIWGIKLVEPHSDA